MDACLYGLEHQKAAYFEIGSDHIGIEKERCTSRIGRSISTGLQNVGPCMRYIGPIGTCRFGFGGSEVVPDIKSDRLLAVILAQLKRPLKDAAALNATRWRLYQDLDQIGLPLEVASGGRTKFNRIRQDYRKEHWIDAACVGASGESVIIPAGMSPLIAKATGHGSRQMCRMDQFGFPRTSSKSARVVKGFRTGDMVKAVVPSGKKTGTYVGKVAIRSSGYFNIVTSGGTTQGVSFKHCRHLHMADGYHYERSSARMAT